MDLDHLVECLKALSDKTRLKILALLRREELCVCELVEVLKMTQPAISQHLRKLKNVKLVKERKEGQWVIYSVDASSFPFFESIACELPDMSQDLEQLKKTGLKKICNS